jgi:proteasome lid subunit RPN8/RPN11
MIFPYSEIVSHCKKEFPNEACGLVIIVNGEYEYVPCTNTTDEDPTETFNISALDYADAEDRGEVYCVVHSHTKYPARPSQTDLDQQKVHKLPWLIVGLMCPTPQFEWVGRDRKIPPLFGRKFEWHEADCYSFIKDYYELELNILLPDFYRRENFWDMNEELYLVNYKELGFKEVEFKDLQKGDIILLQLMAGITSHAAIYLGGNEIGHHVGGRLSGTSVYGNYYIDRTTKCIRHKSIT